ncbi:uncharacterized protein [Mytilus edulis]|uniref:uncharacterized protein n=1 Tax=Mytilus edulis TaxID=6550 RepID=UPI0039F0570A
MSIEKSGSLSFYNYLCQKIGSEEVVKIRRLESTIRDIGDGRKFKITSGSKGEGLDFKSSDLDLMYMDTFPKVYQSQEEVVHDKRTTHLILKSEETPPCYTQLCILNHHGVKENMVIKTHLGYMLSSEQYKQYRRSRLPRIVPAKLLKIHGPCISDTQDRLDIAYCLKCDQWVSQAQPWVCRPRNAWPSTEIVSKIISCGVLIVPVGCKGSRNENLEWRISFSIPEKFLVFSFSHTQLLCYALLKILMKELVDKHEDLKGLLCSYFLKSLMFWISEETEPNLWQPDNIIPCFKACLQRLLYCARYSILSHYFIPDNNLFNSRFNVMNKDKLTTILKNLYEQGIACFIFFDTLQYCQKQSYKITESLNVNVNLVIQQSSSPMPYTTNIHLLCHLLYTYLHHSKTGLSKALFASQLSKTCPKFAQDNTDYPYNSENKHQYFKYKYDLSHLLIGLHSDAVSGWLKLASLFYVHKNYFASLSVIHYALQKTTDEKIYHYICKTTSFEIKPLQKHVLDLMKKEKLFIVLKALTINPVQFFTYSYIIPVDLQMKGIYIIHLHYPLAFGHFLNFLCYYHLQDITSCKYSLQKLESIIKSISLESYDLLCLPIFCGIAYRLMGKPDHARQMFQRAARLDYNNLTGAGSRLSNVI